MQLFVIDVGAKEGPSDSVWAEIRNPTLVWNRDETKLYVSAIDPEKELQPIDASKPYPLVSWEFDQKTKQKKRLTLPDKYVITDLSPDGKTLLTRTEDHKQELKTYLVPLDTLIPQPLLDKQFGGLRFFPDGTQSNT